MKIINVAQKLVKVQLSLPHPHTPKLYELHFSCNTEILIAYLMIQNLCSIYMNNVNLLRKNLFDV